MSTFWIVMIVLSGFAFVSVLMYLAFNCFFYYLSLSRKSLTRAIVQRHIKKNYKKFKFDFEWFDKKKSEDLTRRSADGKRLVAKFYKRKDDNKLAIVCHGYGADYREMGLYVKYFYNRGYSVLIPQFKAHGQSEGKRIGMGWSDRLDIKGWIKDMVKLNPEYRIVLFGLSMGASTVCMTVGEDLPNNVRCAISDCGYANVYDQFASIAKKIKLNPKLIMTMYNNFLSFMYGINLKKYDAVKQLKKAKVPMLFIHGTSDEFVPYENLHKLYEAYPNQTKMIYSCEGASHAMSYPSKEKKYEKVLGEFLKKYYDEKK